MNLNSKALRAIRADLRTRGWSLRENLKVKDSVYLYVTLTARYGNDRVAQTHFMWSDDEPTIRVNPEFTYLMRLEKIVRDLEEFLDKEKQNADSNQNAN